MEEDDPPSRPSTLPEFNEREEVDEREIKPPDSPAANLGTAATLPEPADPQHERPKSIRKQDLFDLPIVGDFDRYDIEGEYAKGGLGRILGAWDRRLDRFLAFKELLISDPRAEVRFIREALITARLQHPSIVPVHDAGRRPDGRAFYTMKMISGRSLKEAIAEVHNLDERLALLPNIIAVADAMAYAHDTGILHRDLKPANILIGPFGETVVIDWGLAKDLRHAEEDLKHETGLYDMTAQGMTVVGTVLGTPPYMPPEQARGERVDERADVYALGAVLYHLLAGTPPYEGETAEQLLSQIKSTPPLSLEARQSGVPPDLVTIVRKAMARDSRERYPTARELAEDLRRFQTGQLVSARRYSTWTLIERWLKRHRLAASLMAIALIFLGLTARFYVEARERGLRARSLDEATTLLKARGALERDPTEAIAWLKEYPVDGGDWATARDIALEARRRGVTRQIFRRDDSIICYGAFSPDGKHYACAGQGHTLRLWDATTGETWRRLEHVTDLFLVRFSPNGKLVGFIDGLTNVLRIWDHEQGSVLEFPGQDGQVDEITFSPDSRWVLPVSAGETLRLCSLVTDEVRIIEGHQPDSESARFSADGRLLAFAGKDHTVRLYELATGHQRSLKGHEDRVRFVHFLPDRQRLASSAKDGSVRLWDVASGQLLRTFHGHQGEINALTLSPDGRHLASAGEDRKVHLWNLDTGDGSVLQWPLDRVYSLAFSPDGHTLAGAGQPGGVRLWDIDTGESWVLAGHRTGAFQVTFSPDGKLLASDGEDTTSRLWEMEPHRNRTLGGHGDRVFAIAFSPDGQQLASGSRDNTIRLWDLRKGVRVLLGHERGIRSISFSPDSTQLASASSDQTVRLWDVRSGRSRVVHRFPGRAWAVSFSSDGEWLAASGAERGVWVEPLRGKVGYLLPGPDGEIHTLAFAPRGHLLSAGGVDRKVWLWDLDTGTHSVLEGHEDRILRVIFSHDGRFVASIGADRAVRLWDVVRKTGRLLGRHTRDVFTVDFSPDDRFLASGGEDQAIRVWDLESSAQRELVGHEAMVRDLAFSPRGAVLASVSWDGMLRVWDVASGTPQHFYQHGASVLDLAFSPDGKSLATAGTDRLVRLWSLEASAVPPHGPEDFRDWMQRLTSVLVQSTGLPCTP
jgi:WD40 repeat protein/serine/threonine protein kinase